MITTGCDAQGWEEKTPIIWTTLQGRDNQGLVAGIEPAFPRFRGELQNLDEPTVWMRTTAP